MTLHRLATSAALAAALTVAVLVPSGTAGAATPPALPQNAAAQAAANWLAAQVQANGSIPSATSPGTADLTATANTALALATSGVDHAQAMSALGYLEANVDAYVTVGTTDGPGQLALLILDAHALGVSPTDFGNTDLVSRLLATQQTGGAEQGLFGAQPADYDGTYRQGLALAALHVAGVTSGSQVSSAISWLSEQQCPDGGWTSLETADNPCNGSPAQYEGPDTNSTALAIQGLEAQGALGAKAAKSALHFLKKAQDADGGWGYEPNSAHAVGSTDPDSTALVLQALVALGEVPSSATFTKSGTDPVASLLADQVTSGPGTGGISFPGSSDADLLATYQAVPALVGMTFAYDLAVPTLTRVGPSHGVPAGGTTVHLKGSSLGDVGSVMFGSTPAASFTVTSPTAITAVAPAGTGTVSVTVSSSAGTSAVGARDHYTYG